MRESQAIATRRTFILGWRICHQAGPPPGFGAVAVANSERAPDCRVNPVVKLLARDSIQIEPPMLVIHKVAADSRLDLALGGVADLLEVSNKSRRLDFTSTRIGPSECERRRETHLEHSAPEKERESLAIHLTVAGSGSSNQLLKCFILSTIFIH